MEERTLYTKRFRVMGGWGVLRFVDDRGRRVAERIGEHGADEARRIERRYSRFRDDSVLSEINRNAGRTPVAVDEETTRLIELALDLARRTGGAFDPTAGVLRRAWRFDERRVPAPEEVEALLPLIDYRKVSLRNGTVFLRRAGMELDLGGIGKEYAADRVAERLRAEGIACAVVDLGGDLRTIGGRGDGKPWNLGVRDPRRERSCRFAVRLIGDAGVASSGDYERCFEVDGVRYHHLLDARTGWPARGVAAATVVAATACEAGMLATGAFLLGPQSGLALLQERQGIEGALIAESGELLATTGMDRVSDLPGSLYARYPGI